MAVNHEIPKCKDCSQYMTIKNSYVDRFGNTIYEYYCDNLKCDNNKIAEVVEGK